MLCFGDLARQMGEFTQLVPASGNGGTVALCLEYLQGPPKQTARFPELTGQAIVVRQLHLNRCNAVPVPQAAEAPPRLTEVCLSLVLVAAEARDLTQGADAN